MATNGTRTAGKLLPLYTLERSSFDRPGDAIRKGRAVAYCLSFFLTSIRVIQVVATMITPAPIQVQISLC